MSLQWLNQCQCTHENHKDMPRGKCIARNIVGKICEDCAKSCSGLTPLTLDGGDSAALQALSTPEVLSTLQGESTPAHRK